MTNEELIIQLCKEIQDLKKEVERLKNLNQDETFKPVL